MTRLLTKFKDQVSLELKQKFGYRNPMQVPRVVKVVLNSGVGRATSDSKLLDAAKENLAKISGQRPVETKARKSIAGFKVREGQTVGLSVTLRGVRAHEFLDRLISVVLPRIRDFRGLDPRAFDGRGNFNLGVKDIGIFPETAGAEGGTLGLQVSVATSAKNNEEALELLTKMGFPFQRSEE